MFSWLQDVSFSSGAWQQSGYAVQSACTAVSQTDLRAASFWLAKDCCIRSTSFHFVGNKKRVLKLF
jgi:hypothetical protein